MKYPACLKNPQGLSNFVGVGSYAERPSGCISKNSLWALLIALPATGVRAHNFRYSDIHLHYVDFFQESAGITKLLEGVASAKIEHAVFTGTSGRESS